MTGLLMSDDGFKGFSESLEILDTTRLEYIMLLNLFYPAILFYFTYYSHFYCHLFSP